MASNAVIYSSNVYFHYLIYNLCRKWKSELAGRREQSNSRRKSQTGVRDHPAWGFQSTHLDLGGKFGPVEEEEEEEL